MKFINFKLILSILLLSSINAFAVIDVVHLGSFGKSGAWQAKEFKDGTSKICYIISKPIATNPSDLNRGELFTLRFGHVLVYFCSLTVTISGR